MKTKFVIVLLFLFAGTALQAQENDKKKGDVYNIVEEMPEYPGGIDGLKEFMVANIKYPEQARKNKVEGKVFVSFVVGKNGSVSNAKVVRSVDPELDKEALRVVNAMEKWTPGKEKGKPVKVQFTLPIQFALN